MCIARRDRSNTPLQALTLLNDSMFTEAATALVTEALGSEAKDPKSVASRLFRRVMTRTPSDAEVADVVAFYEEQMERLKDGNLSAKKIATESNGVDHAAWVMVTRVLLNLDEFVTKG